MKRVILASASPRRRELMGYMGIGYEVIVSDAEEEYQSSEPAEIVQELARLKAENVAQKICKEGQELKDMVVIGADTIVVCGGRILGKPGSEEEAFDMLEMLQGRMHKVYTGVALLVFDAGGKKTVTSDAVETKVYVHEMTSEEIWAYIATKEPMDKAGAYGIQGRFAVHIDRIEGDHFNVVGLPVSYLYRQLKAVL